MKPNSTALAVSLLSSALLLNAQAATAQATLAAGRPPRRPANDTAGAKLHAQVSSAGHDNPDHRRSQPRSDGEENE